MHSRGLGTDTVRALARHLIDDVGHHRLVIDPAADNHAATRCYTGCAFVDRLAVADEQAVGQRNRPGGPAGDVVDAVGERGAGAGRGGADLAAVPPVALEADDSGPVVDVDVARR